MVLGLRYWEEFIVACIAMHLLVFAIEYHGMPDSGHYTLYAMRVLLTTVYVVDVLMRIILHGLRFTPNKLVFGVHEHTVEIITNLGITPRPKWLFL